MSFDREDFAKDIFFPYVPDDQWWADLGRNLELAVDFQDEGVLGIVEEKLTKKYGEANAQAWLGRYFYELMERGRDGGIPEERHTLK